MLKVLYRIATWLEDYGIWFAWVCMIAWHRYFGHPKRYKVIFPIDKDKVSVKLGSEYVRIECRCGQMDPYYTPVKNPVL